MFITITGDLGSGKSTVADLIVENYGYEKYSTGTIQREIAAKEGLTTLELNKKMADDKDYKYDRIIDESTVKKSKECEGQNIIFDSRLAWHFVEKSLKIYVKVDPKVAGERVFNSERGAEKYKDALEATEKLLERKRVENERYKAVYNVDCSDMNNFDLVLDSTSKTPEELMKEIMDYIENNCK